MRSKKKAASIRACFLMLSRLRFSMSSFFSGIFTSQCLPGLDFISSNFTRTQMKEDSSSNPFILRTSAFISCSFTLRTLPLSSRCRVYVSYLLSCWKRQVLRPNAMPIGTVIKPPKAPGIEPTKRHTTAETPPMTATNVPTNLVMVIWFAIRY